MESTFNPEVLREGLKLIEKYNVPGPRYTSYPTAVEFEERFDPVDFETYLKEYNSQPRRLSLYFHIPFCFSLCWYCGCTKIITRDASRGEVYIDYLEKEMDRLAPLLHKESRVVQLHFGGGTPTFLSPDELRRLGAAIHHRFHFAGDAEISIEIDPRRLTRDHVTAIREAGFNRASLGIQDTNADVQEAIHRIQPMEKNREVTGWLREAGFESVNFDLIYGLPRQTTETFTQTLEDILELEPDRLAVYSYAHVPWIMPAQKLLNEDEFPSTDEKLGMLSKAIRFLTSNGYEYIGMDHFARTGDELAEARSNGTLQRNFQGYSTHGGTDLYAFGMSGISQVGKLYYQNTKDINAYYEALDDERWAVQKTRWLNEDDLLRRDVIMQLMCRTELPFAEVDERWGIEAVDYFHEEIDRLDGLEADGLVERKPDRIKITSKGRLFLRNIAMVFDRYLHLKKSEKTYSKTV